MRTLILLLTVWLSGCAVLDSHNVIGRMAPPQEISEPLSPAQRTKTVELVGETIQARYIDPNLNGVDWRAVRADYAPRLRDAKDDDAFWELLDRMVGELRDSHTRVESPKRVERRRAFGGGGYGITLRRIDNAFVVTGVHPDSDAWFAGLRIGMTVEMLQTLPTAQLFEESLRQSRQQSTPWIQERVAISRLTDATVHETLRIGFTREDGARVDVTLKPRRIISAPTASHRTLPSGFGYVRLSGFYESLRGRTLAGVRELKDTPGLILDLRGNGGGSGGFAAALLSEFMTKPSKPVQFKTRADAPIRILGVSILGATFGAFSARGADAYAKPVVVLLDHNSASASELTAAALREMGNTTIVGQTSCGCLLGFLGYMSLPGGGELAYSEVGFVTASGKRIEGEGVVPDVEVTLSRDMVRSGRDYALEAAVATLRTKTGRP